MIDVFSLTGGIPQALSKLLSSADSLVAQSKRMVNKEKALEDNSKNNYKSVPVNATIREERVKCGKPYCLMCPHGPYYYAYWKDVNGRLKKKYIGSKYDPTWKNQLTVKNRSKRIQKRSKVDF